MGDELKKRGGGEVDDGAATILQQNKMSQQEIQAKPESHGHR